MFGLPTKLFHGDLQFDNVLFAKKKSFQLIDWRQDFAGGHIGDVYYDLAKMYGGILMSYKLMKDENNFHLNIENVPNESKITYSYKSTDNLKSFLDYYEGWITDNEYDLIKIKNITSLIFLNMSPLHDKNFGDLLFFISKEMLETSN